MKIFIKNFFRTKMSVLTAKSIKHFLPDAEIHVLCLYRESPSEYHSDANDLKSFDSVTLRQTKYHGFGNGAANPKNCSFFTEGYNYIYEIIQNSEEKWLMIAEDHFFTKGEVLKSMVDNDFDVAWARWAQKPSDNMNASIICFRPNKFKDFFPMDEGARNVESYFHSFFIRDGLRTFKLPAREADNYYGDGRYTNDYDVIHKDLKEFGII